MQWWIADAATKIHAARLMTYERAWKLDQGRDVRTEISMIKAYATEMAWEVIDHAMQLYGAMGMTKELPLQLMAAQMRTMRIYDGPDRSARMGGGPQSAGDETMSRGSADDHNITREGHRRDGGDQPPAAQHVSVDLMRDLADALEALDGDTRCARSCSPRPARAFAPARTSLVRRVSASSGIADIAPLYEQAVRLFSIEKPIVAAIQGAAVGAGLGLALIADFRVATPEARFAANFVKLGFHPGFGLTHTLPRLIGASSADLMFLTGRRIKAEEALNGAWWTRWSPRWASLRERAFEAGQEIAENAPLAVVSTRATMRAGLAKAVQRPDGSRAEEQTILRATEDFAEGVRSVAERRAGAFKGK